VRRKHSTRNYNDGEIEQNGEETGNGYDGSTEVIYQNPNLELPLIDESAIMIEYPGEMENQRPEEPIGNLSSDLQSYNPKSEDQPKFKGRKNRSNRKKDMKRCGSFGKGNKKSSNYISTSDDDPNIIDPHKICDPIEEFISENVFKDGLIGKGEETIEVDDVVLPEEEELFSKSMEEFDFKAISKNGVKTYRSLDNVYYKILKDGPPRRKPFPITPRKNRLWLHLFLMQFQREKGRNPTYSYVLNFFKAFRWHSSQEGYPNPNEPLARTDFFKDFKLL
jgi:hypothetical protein